jgi:ribonuclease D
MICCQFLGEEKVGLAAILHKYFGLALDKRYQRADWSKRPLAKEMIAYAAADTSSLHDLASLLEEQLRQKNRQHWVAEEFELLEKVRHTEAAGPLFFKAKGAWVLHGHQLAALEGLLQWRDAEAYRLNRPLFKVIDTTALVTLAQHNPATLVDLGKIALPARLLEKYGRQWLEIIREAHALPKEKLPAFPPPIKIVDDQPTKQRLKLLKKWRADKALEIGLDPGLMINGTLLEEIASQPPAQIDDLEGFPTLKNWQRSELGHEIVKIMAR